MTALSSKHVISLYGDNFEAVNTVAYRLRNLTGCKVVSHPKEVYDVIVIITASTKSHYCFPTYNHNVCETHEIDDNYVVKLWMSALKFFYPEDHEERV